MPDYLKARLFEILSLLLKIRRYVTLQELATSWACQKEPYSTTWSGLSSG